MISKPILYTFRRCPYAMRARSALLASKITVELREVSLRDKPATMLAASPKGSVPVLILPDGKVIDESWDIMIWALHSNDAAGWLGRDQSVIEIAKVLVMENDASFKRALDRYKYPERFPVLPQTFYRTEAEYFIQSLEKRLKMDAYLTGKEMTVADAALLPFVRQFASVDAVWFAQAPYPAVRNWLNRYLSSDIFSRLMETFPIWHEGDEPVYFGPKSS